MKTKDFMENYITIKELDDEEITKELRKWYKMTLIEEAVEYDKEFAERICKSCYEKELENLEDENELNDEIEIEKRLERLKNPIKVLEIEVSDGELLRLISMEYRDIDILSADFIKLFQEYKNESEKEIRRILDEYLKKFEIEESEEEVEKENDNSDDSEKIGEILKGFGLSQNSDSNNSLNIKDSDNESELSDYNLQDLFQENISLNMAAERNHIREDLRTFGNIMLGHDIGNDWNALVPPADTIFGRINQVETRVGNLAGPVNRAAKGANQIDKIRKAAACMRGEAADWYENKRGEIQRWEEDTHNHGNNNFTKILKDHYASDIRKNQWIRELQTIR
ncbi:hypothetical protein RhiirA1_469690 [Rhizophagus irregularis]|uniref:Uncharacterized protein n=1 Tax=Rhizophagus irregularis TaxID=588596 RepID=A0A2I1DT85_9GLOM|nr:hypothetical protein RhiirA1_469690 [Rhizophagus irregularis]PKY13098.1 hypothetical protein RhiirB3_424843 [Rhizophagus irregularis]